MKRKIEGHVYEVTNGVWEAKIQGGWWVSYATSKKAAIKSVTKRYNDELDKKNG